MQFAYICSKLCAKNDPHRPHVILNILYSCKSIAMEFNMWYPSILMILAIKHIHNLPHHLSYVLRYLTLHKHWKFVLSSSQ